MDQDYRNAFCLKVEISVYSKPSLITLLSGTLSPFYKMRLDDSVLETRVTKQWIFNSLW
jgi:hypothetical protein